VYGRQRSATVHGSGQGLSVLSATTPLVGASAASSVGGCAESLSATAGSLNSLLSSRSGNNNQENNGVSPIVSLKKETKTFGRRGGAAGGGGALSLSTNTSNQQQQDDDEDDKRSVDKKGISKRKHGENTIVVPDKKATKALRKVSPSPLERQRSMSASTSGASLSSIQYSSSSSSLALSRGSSSEAFDTDDDDMIPRESPSISRLRTQTHPPTQRDAHMSPKAQKSGIVGDSTSGVGSTTSAFSIGASSAFRSNSTALNSR